MKVRNRILNIFLAIMLVLTTILSSNMEIFATASSDVIRVQNAENEGIKEVKDKDGNLSYRLKKIIEEAQDGKATITIGAQGGFVNAKQSIGNKLDIVFLVDTSGSMKHGLDGTTKDVPVENQRITRLKQILKDSFSSIQELTEEDVDVNVGLISFSTKSYVKLDLTKVNKEDNNQKNNWNSIIDSLIARGSTYTDKALLEAENMLTKSDANKKIVVLMTDGHPTYSTQIINYEKSEFNEDRMRGNGDFFMLERNIIPERQVEDEYDEYAAGYFQNCTVPEYWKIREKVNRTEYYYNDYVPSHTVGEKPEYIEGYFKKGSIIPKHKAKNKKNGFLEDYFTDDDYNVKDNGVAGILRAKMLKDKDISIYTMGIGVNHEILKEYLKNVANTPDMFYPDLSSNMSNFTKNLEDILYKEIVNPAISNETFTDTMGDKVKLSSEKGDIIKTIDVQAMSTERKQEIKQAIEKSLKVEGNTITIDNITLNEGESFTINYDIEPDLEKLEDKEYDVWLDANKIATLGRKRFPIPQIKVNKPELKIIKIDKNTGNALEGAEFALYKDGVQVVSEKIVTDEQGIAKVKLPYGKYELIETKAPNGYKKSEESTPVEVNKVKGEEVRVENEVLYRTLVAEKQWLDRKGNKITDEEANKYQVKISVLKLVGEEKVQLKDEEVKGNLTITGNGKIEFKVPAMDKEGNFIKYYLSEEVIDSKDGQVSYNQKTEDIKDPENKDQVNGLYGVRFINQIQDLDIKKIDGSTNQVLQGINFEISKDGNVVSSVSTNSNGMLDSKVSLEEGDYLLSETNAQVMGYKETTPVMLRVTTDSILLVNKDENGQEIGAEVLPNGVVKVINYAVGIEGEPKVVPGDKKEEDPTPVPDPDKPQPNPDPQPNPNPQPNPQPSPDPQPSPNQDGGSRRRNRDNEPNPRRVTPPNEVTVNENTTPLAVPDNNNNETVLNEEKTPLTVPEETVVEEETTPLETPDKNVEDTEEVQEDKVPLSLPKTGNKDSMIYIILGMAIAIFGIKKFRK